ncbi:MAG: glycosyltransferase [Chloroflexi bacterium]|nr:glycosyltransferase [Chloroflexota bacterium]
MLFGKGETLCHRLILDKLPPPPPGKTGWPWTEASPALPDTMPDGSPWPWVSIVTPSYNQGQFLEETIRSVLLQGYPNLEYMVMDGGSTDESIAIIRKYEPWLDDWVSEKDRGQCHAINKGWKQATGEILAYLNSDDPYLPDAIRRAVEALAANPGCDMVYSDGLWIDEKSEPLKIQRCEALDARKLLTGKHKTSIPQPTAFIRQFALDDIGYMDEELHMGMDYDLWFKLALRYSLYYLPGPPLAGLRFHADQKTNTRVLESRLAGLVIMNRTLRDPRCPPDIARKGEAMNIPRYLDIAGVYWRERHDFRNALDYFMRALRAGPLSTVWQLGNRATRWVYWSLLPSSWRRAIRKLRGVDDSVAI